MWGHYGSNIVKVFSKPLIEMSSSTTNIFWWYKPSFYGGLCPIRFFNKLDFCGSLLMF